MINHSVNGARGKLPAPRPVFLALLLLLVGCATTRPAGPKPDPVILVSIDGFRHAYLRDLILPRLLSFPVQQKMSPSFPSLTFPSHYTMATGLPPAKHGIVGNEMYDPRTGKTFRISDRAAVADPEWWGGEPIWITAEKAGILTAPYFWVGSTTEINGRRPTYWIPYDQSTPRETRVKRVLELLDLPDDKRPRFITTYFDDVDSAGHAHGPRSPEVARAALAVDTAIGQLLDGLHARGLDDAVNVIVVSDHGMTEISRSIALDALFPPGDARLVGEGALVHVFPEKKSEAELLAALDKRPAHVSCWKKDEFPLVYRDNPRIAPILCMSNRGWYLTTRPGQSAPKGAHGWDPRYRDMQSIFLARGPAFPPERERPEPFWSGEVHDRVAELLRVAPATQAPRPPPGSEAKAVPPLWNGCEGEHWVGCLDLPRDAGEAWPKFRPRLREYLEKNCREPTKRWACYPLATVIPEARPFLDAECARDNGDACLADFRGRMGDKPWVPDDAIPFIERACRLRTAYACQTLDRAREHPMEFYQRSDE